MSDPPPGKKSRNLNLLRPFKGLFSRRSHLPSHQSDNATASISASPTNSSTSVPQVNSPSHQGAQSVTPYNATASISASVTDDAASVPQASYQGSQSVTPHNATASISASPTDVATSAPQASHQVAQSVTPNNARASISASPTNNATSTPQVNPHDTEYTSILELSTTPSAPLTWEHRMKEYGSTAYEGLKTAIKGIYDCSGMFPPLQTTAGVLLTISKVVDVRGSLCSSRKYINNVLFYLSDGFSK